MAVTNIHKTASDCCDSYPFYSATRITSLSLSRLFGLGFPGLRATLYDSQAILKRPDSVTTACGIVICGIRWQLGRQVILQDCAFCHSVGCDVRGRMFISS
jgi:hypothetical protein